MTALRFIRNAFSILNAAIAVTSDVRQHRMPTAGALQKLGIREADFRTIQL
ncbi:hypothetical protein [Paracoccus shanxieyensis]|uniref:Uncharacterized protein n=1 Tax=Paracoccus shanxieyensis TaxID=2675752 RepID=A0A6L6IXM9_9RHOB|nr:hypothetical protein [Paracoccus shanxieyensis]MTH64973.1 hypothetical protein [Paracoccus shanxieyensis]MTH88123.1 hypothetical protein [Paracoccus shanxieyensis]